MNLEKNPQFFLQFRKFGVFVPFHLKQNILQVSVIAPQKFPVEGSARIRGKRPWGQSPPRFANVNGFYKSVFFCIKNQF